MKSFNIELQGRCGVYVIFNLVNGKRYVGSAKDLYARLCTHLSLLKNQREHNKHLQNAWNKYGENAFDYGILEYCELKEQFNREQYYINSLKPEYNKTDNVVANFGHITSEECKTKISATLKRRYATGEIKTYRQQHLWIHCYLYDAIEFTYLGEFDNTADCVKLLDYKHGEGNRLFNILILGRYILTKEKFECISDLKNYVYKNFRKMKLSPIYGQRYLVVEQNDKINYFESITKCCALGISKSMIMKHLDASIDNPYTSYKFPDLKIYFINDYIDLPYDAAKIPEGSLDKLTKNGEVCDDNTVVIGETKESPTPYSVEIETANAE